MWEGNQVWIVLGLVLLWTGFPSAFAAIAITLFVPLAASVLGLVLRGVGFAFRHEAIHPGSKRLTGALFATSSLLAPFFLGTAVGAVTTGRIPVPSHGLGTAAWTTPTGLVTGGLFVAACAFIGAVYLVGDAHRRGHRDLVPYFGHRAILSGLVTGVLAGVNLALLHGSAPYVFGRLTGVALPLVIVSVLAGGAAVTLILLRRQWLLRIFGALSVAAVVAAWGLAQYPWPFPTHLGLSAAAAPGASQTAEIVVIRHGRGPRRAVLRLPVLAAATRPPRTRPRLGPAAPRRPRPEPAHGHDSRDTGLPGTAPATAGRRSHRASHHQDRERAPPGMMSPCLVDRSCTLPRGVACTVESAAGHHDGEKNSGRQRMMRSWRGMVWPEHARANA